MSTVELSGDGFEGAGSDGGLEPATVAYEDLTADDLTALPPKRHAAKPDFMTTHFPVDVEEFQSIKTRVEEEQGDAPDALVPDDLETEGQEDDNLEVLDAAPELGADGDIGEDDLAMAPEEFGVLAPGGGHSFEGLPQTRFQPPDCAVAVGPDHVLAAVNTSMAIYTKSGVMLRRWPDMTQFFAPVLPTGAGIFDPQVHYDHYNARWIVLIAARRQSPAGSWILLAASQTSDPNGRWWLWALDFSVDGSNPSGNWADYPMLGIDSQSITIGTNQFAMSGGGGFQYGKVRILKSSEVYSGAAIRWWDFWRLREPNDNLAFTVQPCRHFRGRGDFPVWMVNSEFGSGNNLVLWRINDVLGMWSGRAPSLVKWEVPVASYSIGPDARQSGTTRRIETNDDRLLNAVYQSVSQTQRVWTAHTVRVQWSGDTEPRTGIRWYEIDVGRRQVVQQNTYGARGLYYYFPVIQTDLGRNAHVTFGRSGENQLAQLRQTGRRVGDTANRLQGSRLVKAGESSYQGSRWGDYFGIARDGGDAQRVWGYGEFADSSSTWGTWIHSTRF